MNSWFRAAGALVVGTLGACAVPEATGIISPLLGTQDGQVAEPGEAADEKFDPSDPTRVDARAGGGFKYTNYNPDGYLLEFRGKLALQLNPKDLVTIDIGVGENQGVPGESNEFGLTDGRFRYFRMWDVDRTILPRQRSFGGRPVVVGRAVPRVGTSRRGSRHSFCGRHRWGRGNPRPRTIGRS